MTLACNLTTPPTCKGERPLHARSTVRQGFSFVEVLFAVMILGIGFIMIAGVFPVAISQTAATQEETVGAALTRACVDSTREAVKAMNTAQLDAIVPATGDVARFSEKKAWAAIKSSQISMDNSRFAWIPMVRRDKPVTGGAPSTFAQMIIVPVQVRGRSGFDSTDLTQNGVDDDNPASDAATATLMPMTVMVTLTDGGATDPDSIVLASGPGKDAAAPGAVIVISDGAAVDKAGLPMAGRVYRLGVQDDTNPNKYTLLPGNDMPLDPASGKTQEEKSGSAVKAFIVGRGLNPISKTFDGPSMVCGVYVTYIAIKQ